MSNDSGSVTRAELSAHIRRIDEALAGIREDISQIRDHIARPGRWLSGRLTRVVDYALPGAIIFMVAFMVERVL